jgi:hypothetical protein
VETIARDEPQSPPVAALRPAGAAPVVVLGGGLEELMPLRRPGGGLLMGAGTVSSPHDAEVDARTADRSGSQDRDGACCVSGIGRWFRPTADAALARSSSAEAGRGVVLCCPVSVEECTARRAAV